jgi:CheY-like chemotaxis protein
MSKTVVVIEDTTVVRALFVQFLRRFGCRVLEAEDGRTGLALVRAERPDLVLLDISMPHMSGRDVLREIRNDPATHDLPVIMTTAQAAKDVVTEVVAQGVSAYLVKPIGRDRFDQAVAKVLGEPGGAGHGVDAGTSVLIAAACGRDVDVLHDALRNDCRVLTATGSREAVARYRDERPRVALIALDLPELGGWRTLAGIRQLDDATACRCIAVVPERETVDVTQLRAGGFDDHLVKPIDPQQLLRLVVPSSTEPSDHGARIAWHDGVPVVVIPGPVSGNVSRLMVAVRAHLDRLAQDGHDRVLVDLRAVRHFAAGLAHVVADAVRIGKRRHIWMAAIAAPAISAGLQALEETHLPCGAHPADALAALCR